LIGFNRMMVERSPECRPARRSGGSAERRILSGIFQLAALCRAAATEIAGASRSVPFQSEAKSKSLSVENGQKAPVDAPPAA